MRRPDYIGKSIGEALAQLGQVWGQSIYKKRQEEEAQNAIQSIQAPVWKPGDTGQGPDFNMAGTWEQGSIYDQSKLAAVAKLGQLRPDMLKFLEMGEALKQGKTFSLPAGASEYERLPTGQVRQIATNPKEWTPPTSVTPGNLVWIPGKGYVQIGQAKPASKPENENTWWANAHDPNLTSSERELNLNLFKGMQTEKIKQANALAVAQQSGSPLPSELGNFTGDALLEQVKMIDPLLAVDVKGLANYTINPATFPSRMFRGGKQFTAQQVVGLANLYDPSYDQTQFPSRQALKTDFFKGKAALNLKSLNTAVGHLGTLKDAAEKLNNAGAPLWNAVANLGISQVGDPRVKQFDVAADAVAGELANVFKSTSGTDQEIREWRENLSSSSSPAQLRAAVNQAVTLLKSRVEALQNQWETGMGKPKDWRFLSGKARDVLIGMGFDPNTIDPTTGVAPSNEKPLQDMTIEELKALAGEK